MNYGIVDGKGKLIAIFKSELDRDSCFNCIFKESSIYARVKVEDKYRF